MIRERSKPAYLTVYLAMTLGVLVTLCLAMIEGIRLNTMQMELTCIADACTDNVMAEYHRELFNRYNLVALDSSYGSKTVGRTNLEGRLAWYLDKNLDFGREKLPIAIRSSCKDLLGMRLNGVTITDFSLLTDWNGAVFRKQAVEAIKDDYGVVALQETFNWLKTVEDYQLDVRDVEAEKQAVDAKIASYQGRELEETKKTLNFENPTIRIENAKKTGILWMVLGDRPLSGKAMDFSDLAYQRAREKRTNHGTIVLPEQNVLQKRGEALLFDEYLLSYFGNYLEPKENCVLDYEVEYVLAGNNHDGANLRSVLNRLLALREAANATYLFSDKTKCDEVEAVALALSALIGEPELKDLFKTAILLGWAYVESVYDLKVLMRKGKVPLMKDAGSWHYGFSGILEGTWDAMIGAGEQKGLSYQDYLRILLSLANETDVNGRVMNLVEGNLRLTPGNKNFRLDACYVRIATSISVGSGYGYQLEIREDKHY